MPVVGSGDSDLDVQIWSNLGFFVLAFLLLCSKLYIRWKRDTIPINKMLVRYHVLLWSCGPRGHPLADLDGEGRRQTIMSDSGAKRLWGGFLL
jgi:hypothetical protein